MHQGRLCSNSSSAGSVFARINPCRATGLLFPEEQEQGSPSSSRKGKEPGPGKVGGEPVERNSAEKYLRGNYSLGGTMGTWGHWEECGQQGRSDPALGPGEEHLEQ